MNATDRAERVVRGWAQLYTRGVPGDAAERRHDELASDCFEQRAWGRQVGAPPTAVAISMVVRTLAGIPADLLWRSSQIATARGRSPTQRGRPMGQWIKENWWVALAVPLGLMNTAAGIAAPFESQPWEGSLPWWITTPSMLTFGFLLLGGAWVRRRRRVAGDVMIAIGAVSVIPMFWTIILPILGVLIVVAALLDAVDASSVGEHGHVEETKRRMDPVLALLLAGLVAAGVASFIAADADVAALLVVPLVTATIAHIGAKRWADGRSRMHAALVLAGTPLLTLTLTGPTLLLFGDPLDLPQPLAGIVGGGLVSIGIAGVLIFIVELRQTRARARPA